MPRCLAPVTLSLAAETDFRQRECRAIETTLKQRRPGQKIELQRLIVATAVSLHRGYQQYGTGKDEFDEISDCLVTQLQVHADKEIMKRDEIDQ